MIAKDINNLSEGGINLDAEWLKNVEMGHKTASAHQKGGKHQQRTSRQPQKGARKGGQRHNSQK
jgi:hypothetical protein